VFATPVVCGEPGNPILGQHHSEAVGSTLDVDIAGGEVKARFAKKV
jgi:hypothetical protein